MIRGKVMIRDGVSANNQPMGIGDKALAKVQIEGRGAREIMARLIFKPISFPVPHAAMSLIGVGTPAK